MAWTRDPIVAPIAPTLWRGLYVLRSCTTGLDLDLCLLLPRPNHHLIVTLAGAPNSACSPLARFNRSNKLRFSISVRG